MVLVFIGEIVGWLVMVIGSALIHSWAMKRVVMKLNDLFGFEYDEQTAFLMTIILLLIVFGSLFAAVTTRPIRYGHYIRRGLFACFVAGMTSVICSVGLLLPEYWLRGIPGDLFETLIFSKSGFAISFLGVCIMVYYGASWHTYEGEIDKLVRERSRELRRQQ